MRSPESRAVPSWHVCPNRSGPARSANKSLTAFMGAFICRCNSNGKVFIRPASLVDGVAKNGLLDKKFVDFARHQGAESNQPRCLDPGPFGMCPGKTDKAAFDALTDQPVEDCLLAAHDIRTGGVALRHAGENADVAVLPPDPYGSAGKIGKITRNVYISRLLPPLCSACHATDQHRNIGLNIQCREGGLQFGGEIGRRQPAHSPFRATLPDCSSLPVQCPDAKRTGAPVDKDDVSSVSHDHIQRSGGVPPHLLALLAKTVDRHLHHVAFLQEHRLGLDSHADARWRACRDHVTRMQGHQF